MKYLSEAIQDTYGVVEGLITRGGVVTNWPYAVPQPSVAELEAIRVAFKAIRDVQEGYDNDPELPSMKEQVDALIDGGATLDSVRATIAALKIKHGI